MRRFLLILLTLMLALPAPAEEAPAFSADALLLKTANEALEARYGLTPHLLGLFDAELTRYGDVATVRLLPRARPHPSLAGEYLVLISPDSVQAFWSHDDVDPAIWQSGELNRTLPPFSGAAAQAGSCAGAISQRLNARPGLLWGAPPRRPCTT